MRGILRQRHRGRTSTIDLESVGSDGPSGWLLRDKELAQVAGDDRVDTEHPGGDEHNGAHGLHESDSARDGRSRLQRLDALAVNVSRRSGVSHREGSIEIKGMHLDCIRRASAWHTTGSQQCRRSRDRGSHPGA